MVKRSVFCSFARNEFASSEALFLNYFITTAFCLAISFNLLLNQIKSLLYSLCYAKACYELVGPISASLRSGNTAPSQEISQQLRAVGKTVSNLTARDLNLRPPAPETNALPLATWPVSSTESQKTFLFTNFSD